MLLQHGQYWITVLIDWLASAGRQDAHAVGCGPHVVQLSMHCRSQIKE
jgi:hypothetical protein